MSRAIYILTLNIILNPINLYAADISTLAAQAGKYSLITGNADCFRAVEIVNVANASVNVNIFGEKGVDVFAGINNSAFNGGSQKIKCSQHSKEYKISFVNGADGHLIGTFDGPLWFGEVFDFYKTSQGLKVAHSKECHYEAR